MLDWGFIQAGGKSSRMGTDKAWLEIKNRPMIEHALRATRPVANQMGIIISTNSVHVERYEELARNWGIELMVDLHDHRGPLGGIHTALKRCQPPPSSALMLACDLPFITPEILLLLSQIHDAEGNELTMPVDQAGRSQPLAAIYASSCLPVVEELLATDRLRVDGIFPSVKLRRVAFEEFSQLPDLAHPEKLFLNVNTAEDYLMRLKSTD